MLCLPLRTPYTESGPSPCLRVRQAWRTKQLPSPGGRANKACFKLIALAIRALCHLKSRHFQHRLLRNLARIDTYASVDGRPESRAAECAQEAFRLIHGAFNDKQLSEPVLMAYMQGLSLGFYDLAKPNMQHPLSRGRQAPRWPAAVLHIGYHHGCVIRHSTNSHLSHPTA